MNDKKRLIIGGSMLGIVFIIGLFIILVNTNNRWKPKTTEVIFEYGDTELLTDEMFIEENDTSVEIKKIDIDIPIKKNNKLKYYELGEYEGKLELVYNKKDQVVDFKVIVRDTKAPTAVDFNEKIVVRSGYKGDFKEFFVFDDVDEILVMINVKDFDKDKEGTYKAEVIASDTSKNEIKKEFTVETKIDVDEAELTKAVSSDGTSTTAKNNSKKGKSKEVVNENSESSNKANEEKPINPSEVKTQKDVTSDETIGFETEWIADANMAKGFEVVSRDGVNGNRRIVTRIYYSDGVETGRETISNTITANPVNKVITYGTYEQPTAVQGAFGEYPAGLIRMETYTLSGVPFAKEFFTSAVQRDARGADLVARGLIEDWAYGSFTHNSQTQYQISFRYR